MRTKHFLPVLFILIALVACNSTRKEGANDEIIRLPNYFEEGDFSLSEIASDILFIPLSNDIPIAPFREINCFDSIFYLRAFEQNISKLYRFRFDGSFIDVLNRTGRGPEEYLGINGFHVDKNGSIYVNCGGSRRILVYNQDFTYNKTIRHPKELSRAHVRWLDSIIVFFPLDLEVEEKYDWVTTNYQGTILDTKLNPNSERPLYFTGSDSFLTYEKDSVIYRYRNWSDTIFGISSHGVIAKYVFERIFEDGLRMSSLDEIFINPTLPGARFDEASSTKGKRKINNLFDVGDKLIITYSGEKSESILFDPETNQSKILLDKSYGLHSMPNDWSGSGNIKIRKVVKVGRDRYLVDYMEAYSLKSIVSSDLFLTNKSSWPEKKSEFQMLGDRLDENDNPVLILIKLK